MTTRIPRPDLVSSARETSEDLGVKDRIVPLARAKVLLQELADEVERLRAENATLAADRDEIKAIHVASEWLPDDWELRLSIRREMIDVNLYNPDRDMVEPCEPGDATFDEMVLNRVNAAREVDGLCPVDIDGEHDAGNHGDDVDI